MFAFHAFTHLHAINGYKLILRHFLDEFNFVWQKNAVHECSACYTCSFQSRKKRVFLPNINKQRFLEENKSCCGFF